MHGGIDLVFTYNISGYIQLSRYRIVVGAIVDGDSIDDKSDRPATVADNDSVTVVVVIATVDRRVAANYVSITSYITAFNTIVIISSSIIIVIRLPSGPDPHLVVGIVVADAVLADAAHLRSAGRQHHGHPADPTRIVHRLPVVIVVVRIRVRDFVSPSTSTSSHPGDRSDRDATPSQRRYRLGRRRCLFGVPAASAGATAAAAAARDVGDGDNVHQCPDAVHDHADRLDDEDGGEQDEKDEPERLDLRRGVADGRQPRHADLVGEALQDDQCDDEAGVGAEKGAGAPVAQRQQASVEGGAGTVIDGFRLERRRDQILQQRYIENGLQLPL